jgi:hypothetical protein
MGRLVAFMNETCELLDKCGFFKNFKGNSEVMKNNWIKMFCEDVRLSQDCQRKKIRAQTGNPPVDNMSPTGKILG